MKKIYSYYINYYTDSKTREGNFDMIELMKFANSFKYIHMIIKNKIVKRWIIATYI